MRASVASGQHPLWLHGYDPTTPEGVAMVLAFHTVNAEFEREMRSANQMQRTMERHRGHR